MKEQSRTVGLSVTVSLKDKVVFSRAYGFESLEHGRKVDPTQIRGRVAGLSKAMTSAALGLLIEQGKIDIDLPIKTYVPYFPEKKYPITTRQVAGHIAGSGTIKIKNSLCRNKKTTHHFPKNH